MRTPLWSFFIISGDRAPGPMREVIERHHGYRSITRLSSESFTSIHGPAASFFENAACPPVAMRGMAELQPGLGELWEAVRGQPDIVEGDELRKSASRFKKRCMEELLVKSLPFTLLTESSKESRSAAESFSDPWSTLGARMMAGQER